MSSITHTEWIEKKRKEKEREKEIERDRHKLREILKRIYKKKKKNSTFFFWFSFFKNNKRIEMKNSLFASVLFFVVFKRRLKKCKRNKKI